MAFTPANAADLGRIGAYRLHATHDPRETSAKGRAAFLKRFEDEVDPDGVLPESERKRRAGYALKAHMAQLAYRSAVARRMKKAGVDAPATYQEDRCEETPDTLNSIANSEDAGGDPASCKEADRGTDHLPE